MTTSDHPPPPPADGRAKFGLIPHLADGLLVSLEHFHIVHVRLPIFDKAVVVAGNHPCVIVVPHHMTDGRVVGLKIR